jgi:hypothetical protein
MKSNRILSALLIMLTIAYGAYAQASGVHIEKKGKDTTVSTSYLYVYDVTDQFVELQFSSGYKGDKPTGPPANIELTIYSFSTHPLYASRSVSLVADGVETKIGTPHTFVLKGQTNNGADSFYVVDGNPNIGIQVPVPPTAKIKAGGNLNGKTMEWMTLGMKPDPFLKLLKPTKLEIRIGDSTFPLKESHLQILQNFVNQITPQ